MSDDFEVERTLCQLPSVHVIRIPTRKTAEGHRAADWPVEPIWSGKLKITAKGKLATITLLNDKNGIFGICPVTDDAAVERTLDSGRYFVLRLQNDQGKHAFIGIAFNERNDAFEFNVSLQEFRAEIQRENQPIVAPTSQLRDLSLKEGEKIHINVPKKKAADTGDSSHSSGSSGSLLAPPPGNKFTLAPPKGMKLPPPGASTSSFNTATTTSAATATATSTSGSGSSSVDWNSFSSAPSSTASAPASDVFGSR